MKNEVITFNNEEFGSVRCMSIDNEPWFTGKDVASALGYSNSSKAVMMHVDPEDKKSIMVDIATDSQNGNVWRKTKTMMINESGLYSLILHSKLQSAKKFKHWVTSTVLPSIRKNGGYIQNQENLSETEILANAVLVAQKVIEEKNQKILQMTPKADFYDTLMDTKNAIPMGEAAKRLDMNIGRNNLFAILRKHGVLDAHNIPYQSMIDRRYFRVLTKTCSTYYDTRSYSVTMVLPAGLEYIRRILIKEGYSSAPSTKSNYISV